MLQLVENGRCETRWHTELKGEMVTVGLSTLICQVWGQDLTLEQDLFVMGTRLVLCTLLSPRKNPNRWSSPVQWSTFA